MQVIMMWTSALLVFVMAFHTAQAITVEDCPTNLDRGRYLQVYENKCYYFYLHRLLDYSDAQDICYTEGGILATVKSEDVNRFLHSKLAYTYSDLKGNKRVWIGLNDLEKEGTFKWDDGSPMQYENFAKLEGTHASVLHLTRFFEDCVAMDQSTGKWTDYRCESGTFLFDEQRPFICQFDPAPHVTSLTTESTTQAPPTTTTPELITLQTNVTGSMNASRSQA